MLEQSSFAAFPDNTTRYRSALSVAMRRLCPAYSGQNELAVTIQEKRVSSEIGFKGVSKKVLIIILVAIGNIIDQYVFKTGSTLRSMVIMFYLSNEGISILENAGEMGLPLPRKLKDVIKKFNATDEDNK